MEQGNSLQVLLQELKKYHIDVLIYSPMLQQFTIPEALLQNLSAFKEPADLDADVDFMISLGGDGTMLDSITLVQHRNIPILGINFGRLGFLASISRDELEHAVEALVNGSYVVDKRSLIHVEDIRCCYYYFSYFLRWLEQG